MLLFKDGLIECVFGHLQLFRGLIVTDGGGDGLKLLQCPFWLQVLLGLGQGGELLIGRHHGRIRVSLPELALSINDGHWEKTGPVKVNIWIKVVTMEGVELRGPLLGNVDVAQLLANDRPVLTFH